MQESHSGPEVGMSVQEFCLEKEPGDDNRIEAVPLFSSVTSTFS